MGILSLFFSPCAEFVVPCEEFACHKFRTTWINFNIKWYLLEFVVNWHETEYPEGFLPCVADTSVTIFHTDPKIEYSLFAPSASATVEHSNPGIAEPSKTLQSIGQQRPADWTRFDVSRSLRALAAGSPAVQRKELRKLHLRWWHASKESMRRVLSAAGLSTQVLNEIANIVDTCRGAACGLVQPMKPYPLCACPLNSMSTSNVICFSIANS